MLEHQVLLYSAGKSLTVFGWVFNFKLFIPLQVYCTSMLISLLHDAKVVSQKIYHDALKLKILLFMIYLHFRPKAFIAPAMIISSHYKCMHCLSVLYSYVVFKVNLMDISIIKSFTFKVLILALLHSEWPKLHRVLAILSAKGLKYLNSFCMYDRPL